jgi:hypothetical protein
VTEEANERPEGEPKRVEHGRSYIKLLPVELPLCSWIHCRPGFWQSTGAELLGPASAAP